MQLAVALAEERSDEGLKRLCQCGIGNVAFVLVELSGCEQTARRNQRLVQLIDHRGLSDPGIPRDEHQLWPATGDDSIERPQQRIDLTVASVKFLRKHEAIRSVLSAGRESVDASPG